VIVNSPNNPTGVIYPPETLAGLGRLLTQASQAHGRTIYLLSDEAYSRIIFDGQPYPSPTQYYPASVLLYTYGKTTLTPGQRLGYLALGPDCPERAALRAPIFVAQLLSGYAFPNALLQHALPDLESLTIDLDHLKRKRDRMVSELRRLGYEVHVPAGTFYLLPRSPLADDWAFVELLAELDTFVLPGAVVEMPGYFRISLTANDEMIERGLVAFAAAIEKVREGAAAGR
jgi:aspartate aminotransferase